MTRHDDAARPDPGPGGAAGAGRHPQAVLQVHCPPPTAARAASAGPTPVSARRAAAAGLAGSGPLSTDRYRRLPGSPAIMATAASPWPSSQGLLVTVTPGPGTVNRDWPGHPRPTIRRAHSVSGRRKRPRRRGPASQAARLRLRLDFPVGGDVQGPSVKVVWHPRHGPGSGCRRSGH